MKLITHDGKLVERNQPLYVVYNSGVVKAVLLSSGSEYTLDLRNLKTPHPITVLTDQDTRIIDANNHRIFSDIVLARRAHAIHYVRFSLSDITHLLGVKEQREFDHFGQILDYALHKGAEKHKNVIADGDNKIETTENSA